MVESLVQERSIKSKEKKSKDTPPPYHIFTVLDDYFVFDTSACRFYKINKITYDFLDICLSSSIEKAKSTLLLEENFLRDEIENAYNEILLLSENGLFDIPNFFLTSKEFDKLLDIKSYPLYSVELNLSDSCNMACKYCYLSACRNKQNKGFMSDEIIRQAIDMLFSLSKDRKQIDIVLFGGEPLLNKDGFRFAIEYSQELEKKYGKKVKYRMTTNATLLDDDIIENYINKYDISVMISLDGERKVQNAQCPMSDGRESFDFVEQGIKKMIKTRKDIWVRGTMTTPTPNIKNLIQFYEKSGFGMIVIGPANNTIEDSSPFDFTAEDYKDLIQQEEKLIPEFIEQYRAGKNLKYFPQRKYYHEILHGVYTQKPRKLKCSVCSLQVNVGFDGTLYPCNRFNGMKNWAIGHVSSGIDIERCDKFWRDYEEIIKNSCKKCWAYPICNGPCPWQISKSDGTFSNILRFCKYNKKTFEQSAYLANKLTPINKVPDEFDCKDFRG